MTEPQPWRTISVMPTLSVTDLDAAAEFYTKLGFQERWRYPEGAASTHMGMQAEEVSLMFWLCADGVANRQNLYFIMKNLPAFHEQVKRSLPDVSPIVASDYGMNDFAVTDPWGHLLTFGEES